MLALQPHNSRAAWALPVAAALAAVAAAVTLLVLADEAQAGPPCGPGTCYSVSDGSTQNYRWIDMLDTSGRPKPAYNWVEIAPGGSPGGGTAVPGVRTACGPAAPANCLANNQYSSTVGGTPTCLGLGFSFTYYGTAYDCAWVNDNGFIMLDNSPGSLVTGTMAAGACTDCGFPTAAFPTGAGPDRVIAGYWTDLNPFYCGWTGAPAAWGAFTRSMTVGTTQMFIIEWSGVLTLPNAPWSSGCPGAVAGTSDCTMSPGDAAGCIRISFQIQLHKDTNNIEVMLKDVRTPVAPGFTTNAGLGIENGAGSLGLNYGFGTGETYVKHAVRYFPNHAPACPSALKASVLEDSIDHVLTLAASDPDGDTLTYGVTTPSLRGGAITGPTGAAIKYTPPADFYGTDKITFTVKDVFNLAAVSTCEMTVDVLPVNDAPRAGGVVASLPSAKVGEVFTKPGAITGIASGPSVPAPNEFDSQGIKEFEIVSVTPDIFGSGPTFTCSPSPLGCTSATLTFVADTAGTSDICVLLVDEGGNDTAIGDRWRGPLASGVESPLCLKAQAIVPDSGGGTTAPTETCTGPLPTARIGFASPKTIEAGESISLRDNSTAVAPKTLARRTWDFGDGTTAHEATPVHLYPSPGIYVLRLTTYDSKNCASFTDTLVEVLMPGSRSGAVMAAGGGATGPLADAGADRVVREGTAVELRGAANGYLASDVTFRWSQAYPESPKLELEGADSPTLRFTAPKLADPNRDEAYVFALQVTDARSGMVSPFDLVQVDVTSRTLRPIADAGPDATVVPGRDVELDGSASKDPDGDAVTFAWTQVAGPKVALLGADGPRAKLTTPAAASVAYLDFELTVTDGTFTARDTVRVWLQPEGTTPAAFLVKAIPGEPNSFLFQANVPGSRFAWDFGDGNTATGAVVTHTFADAADYKVTMTTLDDARASPAERIVTASVPMRQDAVGADALQAGQGPAWPWLAAAAGIVAATGAAYWLLRRRAGKAETAAPQADPGADWAKAVGDAPDA